MPITLEDIDSDIDGFEKEAAQRGLDVTLADREWSNRDVLVLLMELRAELSSTPRPASVGSILWQTPRGLSTAIGEERRPAGVAVTAPAATNLDYQPPNGDS